MVTKYGMSDKLGPRVFGTGSDEVFIGKDFNRTRDYSEHIAAMIDEEVSGIIDNAVKIIREKNTSKLYAFIGPHISQNSYEVGEELLSKFVSVLGEEANKAFIKKEDSKYLCSLEKLVRLNLKKLSVSKIECCQIDTFTDKSYYSYRRNPITGRLATVISLS